MIEIKVHDNGKCEVGRTGTNKTLLENYFSLQGAVGFLENDIKDCLTQDVQEEFKISIEASRELVEKYWKDLEGRVETLVIDEETMESECK